MPKRTDPTPTRRPIIAVLTNPASDKGRGRFAGRTAFDLLRRRGGELGYDVIDITGGTRFESLRNASRPIPGLEALVVVGGDGMVSLGINAVADRDIPLGIIPCGSGNDFARGLGMPIGHIDAAVEVIMAALCQHSAINIDLGHVRSAEDGGRRVNTFFAGMLNCSIDAAINSRANHSRLPFGGLRYMEAGIWEASHVTDYGFHVAVTFEEGFRSEYELSTPLITIANGRYIGSGIEASPDSDLADGILEMLWIKWMPSVPQALRILAKAYQGVHTGDPLIGYRRIREITLDYGLQGGKPPTLMADGEIVGTLPVRVEAHRKALKLLVPDAVRRQWRSSSDDKLGE
ncbi:hypothetical protein CS006_06340 [Bifidobacterium primatium]|uniref:DAGKc domain-containing protein n=1 Tax=Bifidobacterium primatium TaxID=2045438 RepID=A0A2M9H7V1_9BIFI|nr:diacylglycerol kinase family protein [Bifidobacterium primatium]PJM72874.1 hypothetical protein CS006_06340 [Bifidobacterium primatium]